MDCLGRREQGSFRTFSYGNARCQMSRVPHQFDPSTHGSAEALVFGFVSDEVPKSRAVGCPKPVTSGVKSGRM